MKNNFERPDVYADTHWTFFFGKAVCKLIHNAGISDCLTNDLNISEVGDVIRDIVLCLLETAGSARQFKSTYRLKKAPPAAGPRPSPPSAVRAQASHFDVKTPLAGEIP